MHFIEKSISLFLIMALAACGGGGGNPGTSSGGGSGTSAGKTVETRLAFVVQNSLGVATQSIPVSGGGQVAVTLTDSSGMLLSNQTIKVSESSTGLFSFPNGTSAVTNDKGVALVKINRRSEFKFGLGNLTVQFDTPAGCSTTTGANCLSSSSISAEVRASPPAFKLDLLDANGLITNIVAPSGVTTLKAKLAFEDGTSVNQKRVDVNGDPTKVAFPEGNSKITEDGVALIKISRATQSGAGTLTAVATISGADESGALVSTVVTGSLDYNLGIVSGPEKLTLANLDVGSGPLPAYGTRQVSVQALIGSSPASTPVNITFSSTCGQVLPATQPTNSTGFAVVSFTATDPTGTTPGTQGCSGRNVEIAASAVGADVLRKTLAVQSAPATNLSFVVPADLTKLRIYLEGSGGSTSAVIQFMVTDGLGAPIGSQDVLLTLKTTNGGIPKASIGTKGSTAPVTLTTDSAGKVSVPVYAGTVPTNVLVNAALVSNPLVQTDSSILAVASGRPTPKGMSLSLSKYALRGFDFDGDEATVTVSLADRQGNPVPDGTAVNFVTEMGVMVPPICTTGGVPGDSKCSVKLRTQGVRSELLSRPGDPLNPQRVDGRVSILAYVSGEEEFTDSNFNNVYDCGETFTDLGTAYRDNYASTSSSVSYSPGSFAVPRSASTSSCGVGVTPLPTAGDGVWGVADIRSQAVVVFSTDRIKVTNPSQSKVPSAQWGGSLVTTMFSVTLSDMNDNSILTGSTIAASATDATASLPTDGTAFGTCSLVGLSNDSVPNSLDPLQVVVFLKDCVAGDQVKLTISGFSTSTAKSEFTYTLQ